MFADNCINVSKEEKYVIKRNFFEIVHMLSVNSIESVTIEASIKMNQPRNQQNCCRDLSLIANDVFQLDFCRSKMQDMTNGNVKVDLLGCENDYSKSLFVNDPIQCIICLYSRQYT